MEMERRQEMSIEQRLEKLEELVRDLRADVDIAINYSQVMAQHFGLEERVKKLNEEVRELREKRRGT